MTRSRSFKIASSLFLGLTFICLGLSFFMAHLAVYPVWYRRYDFNVLPKCSSYQERVYKYCKDPTTEFKIPHRTVFLLSPTRTSGWWTEPSSNAKAAIILVHGGGADRRAMTKHIPYLHEHGYITYSIDCFNHGITGGDGRGISFGQMESASVDTAANWIRTQHPNLPIIAMGTSMGAFSSLLAASRNPNIAGVIAENSYRSSKEALLHYRSLWYVNALPRPIKLLALKWVELWIGQPLDELSVNRFFMGLETKPVFLIHGSKDQIVEKTDSEEIFKMIAAIQQPLRSKLWIVEDGEHEFLWNLKRAEYETRVLDFLKENFSSTQK